MKYSTIHGLMILLCLAGMSLNLKAEQKIKPLAPPSSLVLSLDDMLLHFKVFVIVDIFDRALSKGDLKHYQRFSLTDIEIEAILNEASQKNVLLKFSQPLKFVSQDSTLYVHLENLFFKCFRLEVFPGHFEVRNETVSKKEFEQLDLLKKENYQ